jgi:hypothetical protein
VHRYSHNFAVLDDPGAVFVASIRLTGGHRKRVGLLICRLERFPYGLEIGRGLIERGCSAVNATPKRPHHLDAPEQAVLLSVRLRVLVEPADLDAVLVDRPSLDPGIARRAKGQRHAVRSHEAACGVVPTDDKKRYLPDVPGGGGC